MKKILALAAMFISLTLVGCSKEDLSDSGISGGTPYSGDLVGEWEGENEEGVKIKLSFYSDGGCKMRQSMSYDGVSIWMETQGLFYDNGDIVAVKCVSQEVSDEEMFDELDEEVYIYIYIIEKSSESLKVGIIDDSTIELDFEYAQEAIDNYGSRAYETYSLKKN